MNRSRRLPVLVAACAFVLSSCGAHPGSAAVVGSERIGEGQLDEVAGALCAAQTGSQQGGPPQELATRAARQGALNVLISGSLSRQYGESQGVEADQEQVSNALASNAQSIETIPASRREVFRTTLRDYAEGQLMLVEIGRKALTAAGTRNVTEQQALAEGVRLRDAWAAKNVKVSVDPRFGRFTGGTLRPESGSLSAPVSAGAADGSKAQPSTSWVSSLPASQKCS